MKAWAESVRCFCFDFETADANLEICRFFRTPTSLHNRHFLENFQVLFSLRMIYNVVPKLLLTLVVEEWLDCPKKAVAPPRM
jgi:hypothetical protein